MFGVTLLVFLLGFCCIVGGLFSRTNRGFLAVASGLFLLCSGVVYFGIWFAGVVWWMSVLNILLALSLAIGSLYIALFKLV